jgi:hypothetical protein
LKSRKEREFPQNLARRGMGKTHINNVLATLSPELEILTGAPGHKVDAHLMRLVISTVQPPSVFIAVHVLSLSLKLWIRRLRTEHLEYLQRRVLALRVPFSLAQSQGLADGTFGFGGESRGRLGYVSVIGD